VRAAKLKILAPQKLAKDCLSVVGFPSFLTKHKGMLMRFKLTLDSLLEKDSPEKVSKVACQGVSGMVVVDDYYVAESLLSTSSCSKSRMRSSHSKVLAAVEREKQKGE
jgi:hypothetical protein